MELDGQLGRQPSLEAPPVQQAGQGVGFGEFPHRLFPLRRFVVLERLFDRRGGRFHHPTGEAEIAVVERRIAGPAVVHVQDVGRERADRSALEQVQSTRFRPHEQLSTGIDEYHLCVARERHEVLELLSRPMLQGRFRDPNPCAIEESLRWIAANAGQEPAVVVERVKGMTGAMGFNAQTDAYENLVDAGVIDPTKVVRVALQALAIFLRGAKFTTAITSRPTRAAGSGYVPGSCADERRVPAAPKSIVNR